MKAAVFLAALLCAGAIDAAAHHSLGRPAHHRARPTRATRPARPVRPAPAIAIPQESAPPQEAFASFPDGPQAAAPAAASACDRQLEAIALARPLGALVAPGECGAPDAVLLQSVTLPDQSKVDLVPAATLRCPMAAVLAQWVRADVAPAAAKLGAPLRRLEDLGSYDCRGRDGISGATLSEHGRANAIDLRAFRLGNGKDLVLADPRAPEGFRDAVRQSACARFMTVLGPGADAEHSGHVHVDLAPRRNGYKICEWDLQKPAEPSEVARGEEAPSPGPAKSPAREKAAAPAPAGLPRREAGTPAATGTIARGEQGTRAGAGKIDRSNETGRTAAGKSGGSEDSNLAADGKIIPSAALRLPRPRPRLALLRTRTRRFRYPRWERGFISAFFPHR